MNQITYNWSRQAIALLLFFFCGSGVLLQAQISNFPYVNSFEQDSDLAGWTLNNASRYNGTFYDGSYYLDLSSGYVITPELDLSALQKPYVSFMTSSGSINDTIYISTNGTDFTEHIVNSNSFTIPETTKYLKILGGGIDKFTIQESPVVSAFPYVNSFEQQSDLAGWTVYNAYYSSSGLTIQSGEALSTRLELKEEARVVVVAGGVSSSYFSMSYSTDGVSFIHLSDMQTNSGVAYADIPAATRYIKLINTGSLYSTSITYFKVEYLSEKNKLYSLLNTGPLQWVPDGGGAFRLEASGEAYSDKTAAILLTPPLGTTSFNVKFNVSGMDDGKLTLSSGGNSITNDGAKAFSLIGNQKIFVRAKSADALQALPNLRISDIEVQLFTTAIPSLKNLYDTDGDGKKELIKCIENNWDDDPVVSYRLSDGAYSVKDTLLAALKTLSGYGMSDFTLFNANNDAFPDFYITAYETDNVSVSTPDGSYNTLALKGIQWDINADGRPDLYSEDKISSSEVGQRYIHYGQADGSYLKSRIELATNEEYQEALKEYARRNSHGSYILPPPVVGNPVLSNLDREIDFNKDGLPDLLSDNGVLLNLGNNRFVFSQLQGRIFAKDLNGDMIPDMILYDEDTQTVTTRIYLGNGEVKEQVILKNQKISDVWTYDFDRDGDVDVLIPLNYQKSIGYAFLIFAENQGNGKFKIHENYYEDAWRFVHCGDVNNDGYYDLIAVKLESPDAYNAFLNYYMFAGKKNLTFDEAEWLYSLGGYYYNQITYDNWVTPVSFLQDLDNDGIYELAVNDGTSAIIHNFEDITPNSAPAKPTAPAIVLNRESGKLSVSWSAGSDAETAAVDLTYSLRIGSAPGKDDVWFSFANTDGSRLMFSAGNMGSDLAKILDVSGWQPGSYYISVQTVDAAFKGSPFSDEVVYTHEALTPKFILSDSRLYEVDTLTVSLAGTKLNGYDYNWTIPDGHIVEETATGIKVVFDKAGEKTIILQLAAANGENLPAYEQVVEVLANKVVDIQANYSGSYLDFDGNGILDMGTGSGLFSNNGKGQFTKIPKLYNSDLTGIYNFGVIDYNMDGLPDIAENTNKGGVLLNRGDFNFEILEDHLQYYNYNKWENIYWSYSSDLYDFNNDGYLDYRNNESYIYKNSGDNKIFEVLNLGETKGYFVYDWNNDGLWDLVDLYSPIKIHTNKGGFTFETKEIDNPGIVDHTVNYSAIGIRDINNDGYPDLIFRKEISFMVYNYYISYGNREYSYAAPAKIDGFIGGSTDWYIQDMDNNGFPDIVSTNGEGKLVVAYFYPGNEIKVVNHKEYIHYIDDRFAIFHDLNGDSVPDFSTENPHYTKIKNTPPQAPANIRVRQLGSTLLIEWDPAYDAETPYVQMRYNVSVKKKNADVGEDSAFVVSPLNGLNDEAAAVPNMAYRSATRMGVPLSRFDLSAEYEIQVQSIDLWNACSPMSAAITVSNFGGIGIQEGTCTDMTVSVEYFGTETGNITWNLDGGEIVTHISDKKKNVKWNSAGVKNITVTAGGKVYTGFIKINAGKDLSFTLPSTVIAGVPVAFELPELVMLPEAEYAFRTSSNDISIRRREGTREATVTFKYNETNPQEWIQMVVTDTICGEQVYRQYVTVKEGIATPKISLVNIDASTGKNKIIWDKNNVNLNADVTEMLIYKEGSKYNQFSPIGSTAPNTGEFIDYSSNPQITTSRYRIAYNTTYNATSSQSETHRSTHLMLNKGMGSSINLYWTAYEGGIIESYRIYRGLTPESLSLLVEVPGSTNSYTDLTPPEGLFYYAIEYDQVYNTEWTEETILTRAPLFRSISNDVLVTGRSNAVSVVNAQSINMIQSINIMALEDNLVLSESQPQLNLYAEIFPVTADYRTVNWQITSGSEYAYITSQGVLIARQISTAGNVTVRATAVDGSNVYKEVVVPVSAFSSSVLIESIELDISNAFLTVGEQLLLAATIQPANATNQDVIWSNSNEAVATVDANGLVSAHTAGVVTITATTVDGGFTASCDVTVTGENSIKDIHQADILIYPNPVKDYLQIKTNSAIKSLKVINTVGTCVIEKHNSFESIDVSLLISGIYFIVIQSDNGYCQLKFIKE